MPSHDTGFSPDGQESAAILQQATTLLLSTLDLCIPPEDAILVDPSPAKRRRGRPLQLPWTQLWGSLLLCCLGGMRSFADWRRFLGTKRIGGCAPLWLCTNALVKRLLQVGLPPLEELWALVNDRLSLHASSQDQPGLAPFAASILCLDETKLDRLARHLQPLRDLPHTDAALFAGKLLALFDLRAQRWLRLEWREKVWENSLVDLLPVLDGLVTGSLLLFDLGYFSFLFFDTLTDRGLWWISRYRANPSYQIVHTFYRHNEVLDALVWLGTRKNCPAHLVRLVRFGDGVQIRMYVTNVTDPLMLSLAEIPQLYARRWDIELAFRLLKDYLGMHHWWSSKPELVKVQIWVVLILSQALLALRERIAHAAGCEVFAVSVPLLLVQLPDLSATPQPLLETLLAHGQERGIVRQETRLSLCLQVPQLPLEQYLPAPPDLPRHQRAHYSRYVPRPHTPRPSGYRRKREKAEATKRAKAQRVAQAKAAQAVTSSQGSS